MERIRKAVEQGFGGGDVLVVGDLMLDIHAWGSVSRISPEAPVPVVRRLRQTLVAGGAANVAMNLVGLGLGVKLVGLVGEDDAAAQTRQELARAGVDVGGIVIDPQRPTTTKMRIIGGHQQMLRLDQESTEPASPDTEAALVAKVGQEIGGAVAIILSDYAKGVLTPSLCRSVIAMAKERGIPVLVDPKGADWGKYRGATRITPNRSELAVVAGRSVSDRESLVLCARALCKDLEIDALTVTLSEEGILHVSETAEICVPAMAKEVFDVSGAGDTAIAALTASLAVGFEDRDALVTANLAAGIVVGKVGTVPLAQGELLGALDALTHAPLHFKIHDLAGTRALVDSWKAKGEKVVFTNGCFDILHAGHVSYLSKARGLGDRLVLGLNSDASVRRLKGPTRPINEQGQRALVLAGLEAVDAVVVFDEDTPLGLIVGLKPDMLAKGADYREDDVVGAREVRSWGGAVSLVELVEGVSTTRIAGRIAGNA